MTQILSWSIAVLLLAAAAPTATSDDGPPPNIILIFQDDIGFGDLGCYGHPYVRTPNLDRLAKGGTLFRNFHVTGSVCSPSRTGIMTSKHPASYPNYMAEFGFQGADTITELLWLRANYNTAHFGKWHIGPEASDGTYGINLVKVIGGKIDDARGKDADVYDAAIDFLEENKDSEQPFYMNLWAHAAHMPVTPHVSLTRKFKGLTVDRKRFLGKWQQKKFDKVSKIPGRIDKMMRKYVAEVSGMDRNLGRLLQTLDDLNMTKNTIVVFSSDQGPSPGAMGYSGGLRGQKFDQFEGGVRVPFIIRWPGHVPADKVNCGSAISALDWLPSLASITGIPIDPAKYEGEDVSDIWMGSDRSRKNPLFFKFSKPDAKRSMLYGNWKLHWDGRNGVELYDLNTNFEEDKNVYGSSREVGDAMLAQLKAWDETLPTKYALKKQNQKLPFDPDSRPVVIGPPAISAGIMNSPKDDRCHLGEAEALESKPPVLEPVPEPTLAPSKEIPTPLPTPVPKPTLVAVTGSNNNYLYMNDFDSPDFSFSNLERIPSTSNGGGYVGQMVVPAYPGIITALNTGLDIDLEGRTTLSMEASVALGNPTDDDVRFRMLLDFVDGSRVEGDYTKLSTAKNSRLVPFVKYKEIVRAPSGAKAIAKVRLRFKNFSNGSEEISCYVEYASVS